MAAYNNSSLPIAVHVGHDYAIQFANDAFLRNTDGSNTIHADREKLYSVFSNLLNNASKYSPFDTTVSIGCRKEDGQIITEVYDEGPGIPEGDLQWVFDKFYRSAHHPTVSGFGIGLYLCAEIVSMHKARGLGVSSNKKQLVENICGKVSSDQCKHNYRPAQFSFVLKYPGADFSV